MKIIVVVIINLLNNVGTIDKNTNTGPTGDCYRRRIARANLVSSFWRVICLLICGRLSVLTELFNRSFRSVLVFGTYENRFYFIISESLRKSGYTCDTVFYVNIDIFIIGLRVQRRVLIFLQRRVSFVISFNDYSDFESQTNRDNVGRRQRSSVSINMLLNI